MQIYTKYIAGETVLFLVAEDQYERKMIEIVGKLNTLCHCTIKKSAIFQETYLEIRKEPQ